MLTDGDIARIAERIATRYGPLVVGVFGSYAIGRAHAGSDLDLLIIKQTGDAPNARKRSIGRLLFGLLHPVDTPVFTPTEFEASAYDELSFNWVIVRQTRLLYWAPDAPRLVPSLASLMLDENRAPTRQAPRAARGR